MSIPPGYSASSPSQICKLHKFLYGLKQASRQWYSKLSFLFISLCFKFSESDHSLYIKSSHNTFITLLVYVDDLILVGNSLIKINSVKHALDSKFKTKDLGSLRYFLGFKINRTSSWIFFNQRRYTLELLQDTGNLASKTSTSPISPYFKLPASDGTPLVDPTIYKRFLGRLIYLTNSRPNIYFGVQHLRQFIFKPRESHYVVAIKLIRYLKFSLSKGILLSASSHFKLLAFADSDWARCIDTRRSVTCFYVLLGSSLISWKSKKQHSVSCSSTEAEYRSLASLACEL